MHDQLLVMHGEIMLEIRCTALSALQRLYKRISSLNLNALLRSCLGQVHMFRPCSNSLQGT